MVEPVSSDLLAPPTEAGSIPSPRWQAAVGAAVVLVAAGMALGALQIPGDAGYGGVGPNFLPWLCAAVLALCGVLLVREALTGGYRAMEEAPGDGQPDWRGFVWVSAGLLLNAALIERIGFVPGCALAYLLAVQGLRRAFGQRCDTWGVDALTGLAIAAPVFWLFRQLLAIHLPGLTATGWL